ncbi:Phosphate transport system permease protein PstA [Gemmata obscuriglobus]|uniref:Phosphate transport system permease protein PstA n=1 Tax=Gemmata obscuriglobus TaxID=114 RepID=A0A2Z3H8D0_9BACT|nr:phosphate ABC transporter permease PstA [Gemmata obscuriglobus]AWM37310.1 phosphate ABC transporter, permease protein PstA [Gemmata obscuriglobus]QEG29937.1 Phosphate transport system permease protein PstA [Gemmata obscuriglobus]VTS09256.1 phosphate abc transporter permease : Phosphate ABC transporter, permease protein PstC / phosphate ABC transporter, permease protein PstA multi-domain protein OS=Bordetella holmesii CDC-H635-BH GN=L499_A0942 PE=3 SV=1: BPD_transp_1: BPD_transp_1 [Gemmata obs
MSTTAPAPRRSARSSLGDRTFLGLGQAAGVFVLSVAAALLAVLAYQAWPALSKLGELKVLTSADWNPDGGAYGGLLFVYGTVATSVIAMLVAVPLGVGAAACLSELAPARVRQISSFLLELLAAIPSVIFGFWALEFLARRGLAPAFDLLGLRHQSGEGILAAGLVLAVMILPYVTALSFDVCQAVPRSQREGSLALGATRWHTIWKVVLPYARPGIIAACFLALGRAVGETMAVTMVIGNAQHLDFSATATGDTIPSIIAKQLHETTPGTPKRPTLILLGLLLLVITIVMNAAARLLVRWASKPHLVRTREVELSDAPPPDPAAAAAQVTRARTRAALTDRVMTAVLWGCQVLTVVPLFLILGYITYKGADKVTAAFFTNLPHERPPGLYHALVGSVTLVGLASVFAVPIGLMTGVLLSEYRKSPLVAPVRFVAELLGGVPSIVIGVFVYALLVSPFWLAPGQKPWGFSAWAGAFALGVMMLPVVIRSAEEAMRLVPNSLREASFALGASRRQTVLKVVIPAALPAITTGVLLAVGRIAGETAPLILTARGSQYLAKSLSDATPSLPYYVYEFAKRPDEASKNLAWAGAFVLVLVVLMLNVGTRLVAGKRVVAAARAD